MEKKLLTLVLLSSAVGASTSAMAQKTGKQAGNPNVIIILADDLGYGDLECYGAKNVHTPNINRLAQSGYALLMVMQWLPRALPHVTRSLRGSMLGDERVRMWLLVMLG